jgi:uncharacterized protein (TIGR02246 family)
MATFFLRFFAYYISARATGTGDRIMAAYGSAEKQCRRALVQHPRRDARCLLGSWTLMALLALASATARSALAPEPEAAAKEEILALVRQMQDAWNRGDFRGYMQGFKNPDVIFVSGGRFQSGWQGTLDHYVRDYGSSAEARGRLRFFDIRIEVLAPDAAQLISRYELLRPQHPQYGINTRLLRKLDGRWVISVNHVSSTETTPAEPPPRGE